MNDVLSKDFNSDFYYNHQIGKVDSDMNTFQKSQIERICSQLQNLENSEYYVLDLGGGNGHYGKFITEQIKAKSSICYDTSSGMILGKNVDEKIIYVEEYMNKAFTLEKDKKFRVILIKEAIHYESKDFLDKLFEFVKNNLFGYLLVLGRPDVSEYHSHYEKFNSPLPFPRKALDCWGGADLSTKKAYKYFMGILNSDKNELLNFKALFDSKIFDVKLSVEDYKSFLLCRVWGIFSKLSDEELYEEFLRITEKKDYIEWIDEVHIFELCNL